MSILFTMSPHSLLDLLSNSLTMVIHRIDRAGETGLINPITGRTMFLRPGINHLKGKEVGTVVSTTTLTSKTRTTIEALN